MSYLAGNAQKNADNGMIIYERKKVFLHTVCFVIGISFAFFVLGMSFSALGIFFKENRYIFTKVSGILILFLGLIQIGVFEIPFLQNNRRFHLSLEGKTVNPIIAIMMGFTFSFAWTPCIGPALSSVLLMASSAKSSLEGNLLVIIYTIGFIIPFLILGLFTTEVLNFLKDKRNLMKYTIKLGGILLIIIGIMTFTGWVNGISSYLNSVANSTTQTKNSDDENSSDNKIIDEEYDNNKTNDDKDSKVSDVDGTQDYNANEENDEVDKVLAPDFELLDQYGTEHSLADYKGKVIFLNFWATWCGPCRDEMPHIEELYNEFNLNKDDVVILGVANPNGVDVSKEEVLSFLEENEYTYPVLFDETGELFENYYVTAYPTTYMIDNDGNVYGYVSGSLTKDIMKNIINETLQ
jgi:cytochrome c-type biogenesis protein